MPAPTWKDTLLAEVRAMRVEQEKTNRALFGEEETGTSGAMKRIKSLETKHAVIYNRMAIWSGVVVGVEAALQWIKHLGTKIGS